MQPIRVSYYEQTDAPEGAFRYRRMHVSLNDTSSNHPTQYPPEVGDFISLYEPATNLAGTFKVLRRMWSHASWGSTDWPRPDPVPRTGPRLDVMVSRAPNGFFVNEVDESDDDG